MRNARTTYLNPLALALSSLLSLACLGATPPAVQERPPMAEIQVPRLTGHVNDYAKILTAERRAELEKRLAEYEEETTHQLVVLTVPSLQGRSIDSFSLKVASTWKIGRKGLDNGVLVTIAPSERQARIELGVGMNRYVSDDAVSKIMSEAMIPEFRAGQFGKGLERGVERLMEECRAYKVK